MKSLEQRLQELESKHGIDSHLIEQTIEAIEALGENPNEVFSRLLERAKAKQGHKRRDDIG